MKFNSILINEEAIRSSNDYRNFMSKKKSSLYLFLLAHAELSGDNIFCYCSKEYIYEKFSNQKSDIDELLKELQEDGFLRIMKIKDKESYWLGGTTYVPKIRLFSDNILKNTFSLE